MPAHIDITGKKFNRLTAIKKTSIRYDGRGVWEFICDCGNVVSKPSSRIRNNVIKSCGCLRDEHSISNGKKSVTHGHCRQDQSDTYLSWRSMNMRCNNINSPYYGIPIHEPWKMFKNFLKDMGVRESKKLSLDRIDNSKGYFPDNCRWATKHEQNMNRSTTIIVVWEGKKIPLMELAKQFSIPYKNIRERYRERGWSLEKSLTEPIRKW